MSTTSCAGQTWRCILQGCCQKGSVMPIFNCLVCTLSRGVGTSVFLASPLSCAPWQAGRRTMIQTDRLKSGGEAHLLGCRVKKGTSWTWWLGRNAGEGRMLRRYWILKSGARGCVCGRCLLVLLGRYIFFRRENLYSFQKFMSLLDVSLESNIWMILYCCFCYFLFLFSYYRWSISIPEGTAAKFFNYCFYHWHIHDFYDSQNNIFLVLVPSGSMRLRSYISYLVYN